MIFIFHIYIHLYNERKHLFCRRKLNSVRYYYYHLQPSLLNLALRRKLHGVENVWLEEVTKRMSFSSYI